MNIVFHMDFADAIAWIVIIALFVITGVTILFITIKEKIKKMKQKHDEKRNGKKGGNTEE